MNIKSSALFASRIIFPKASKKTVGTKSIVGAIICIALSLIPLVVVLSVSDGMIEGITERIINLSSSHIKIDYSFFDANDLNDKKILDNDLAKIKKIKGVKNAYQLINSSGLVASGKGRTGATIRAIDPKVFLEDESYKNLFHATDGGVENFINLENSSLKNLALVGVGIAEKLNLKSGDNLRLITTQKVNDKIVPKMTSLKIAGIISSGYQELDALWIFIPFEVGTKILKPNNSVTSIMVETFDAFNGLDLVYKNIDEYIKNFSSNPIVNVYRWEQMNKSQYENFSSTKMLLIFIMFLIVLVASVNISSCLVMVSMEHRKEVAILKSVGTKKSIISLGFIFVGLLIGVLGVLIGIPIGIVISLNVNSIINFFEIIINFFAQMGYFIANGNLDSFHLIELMDKAYYLDVIPVKIPFNQIILYIIATILLSLLASLIPAIKAGREKPIETFRKVGM